MDQHSKSQKGYPLSSFLVSSGTETERRATFWGCTALAVLIAIDVALGREVAVSEVDLIAPFAAAFTGARRATLTISVLAVAAAAASGLWNGMAGDTEYWVRIMVVALGSAIACVVADVTADRRQSKRRLELLDKVGSVAEGGASREELLEGITAAVVPEVGDICAIDLVTPGGQPVRAAFRASGPEAEALEAALRTRVPSLPPEMLAGRDGAEPPEPRLLRRLTPSDLRELAHDGRDYESISSLGVRSAMTVPLIARGRCTGALTVASTDPRRFYDDEDLRFASLLAGRVALALDSSGLFLDLEGVERRMETAMAVLGEAVVIHDVKGDALYANAAAYRVMQVKPGDGLAGFALPSLRDRFELHGEDGQLIPPTQFAAIRALRGEDPVPQILRATSDSDGAGIWLRITSSAVPESAGRSIYAVTAMEDITELKQAEFEQSLLARLGELLASSLDYEASVNRLADVIVPEFADWCSVFMPGEDGTVKEVATAHADPGQAELIRRILEEYPLSLADPVGPAQILRLGETMTIRSLGPLIERLARDERHLEMLSSLRMGVVMLLPLRSGGKVVGALLVGNEIESRVFDDADRALAEAIAQRAAAALDNARLATERTQIADTLQKGLLPGPLPETPGWDIAALYRPAGAENDVGGDFYDAFPFDGGWMIVVGDVTGHGARAASVTGQVRHTVRAAATLTRDPLATLATVNRTLLARREPALCGLAAIALGGPDSRLVRVAVAGHPPPLVVGGGEVREAAPTGPVLGAFSDADWTLGELEIGLSQQLVVFTDGVVEAEGDTERFGEERLRDELLKARGPTAAVTLVNEALDLFCSTEPGDDAALLAVSPQVRSEEEVTDLATAAEMSAARRQPATRGR